MPNFRTACPFPHHSPVTPLNATEGKGEMEVIMVDCLVTDRKYEMEKVSSGKMYTVYAN